MKLYTFGYGRTTKERFLQRVKDLKDMVRKDNDDDRIFILSMSDVRKMGSRSINGPWCRTATDENIMNRPIPHLGSTLYEIDVWYSPECSFHNEHGNSRKGFGLYRDELRTGIMESMFNIFCTSISKKLISTCLLCAEEKPFKPNGQPNCHRVVLADEIAKRIGIEVVHVGDNRSTALHGWFREIAEM